MFPPISAYRVIRPPLLMAIFVLTSAAFAQTNLRISFDSPQHFIAAHGRRAWAGGYADHGLEIWTAALQIASDVEPEFRREGDVTDIPGSDVVRKVSAEPSHVTRTYTGPDFSVDEEIWAPLDARAVVFRYKVTSERPVQVIVRFRPSLNLMWPAALGSQEILWNAHESAYVLTDSARQFAAAIVAPGATAHDEPLNSARALPQSDELAISLDPHAPQLLFTEIGATAPDSDISAAAKLLQDSDWQRESLKHYANLLGSELQIETPDEDVNRALAWAEIALDQDWFCNQQLGCGYVAGYGPSRRNRRPQYAWYFAGDGMIALHGAIAAGDLEHAKEELRFIAKYQDAQTGMIWHELTQSAPFIDWRGKYPYMFVHAGLSSPYISAVADYLRATNDRAFLREMWPSVQKAFEYGRSLVSTDGLPRTPAGKEGANEQIRMTDEMAVSADWVEACASYAHLAGVMGETLAAKDARVLAAKARANFLQRYWDSERNFPIEGYRLNGERVMARGMGAIGALSDDLLSSEQRSHILDQLAGWRFESDWGTRSVAMGEPGFDPTTYARGSVWALGTAEVANAYWSAHQPQIAWQVWRSLAPWTWLDSPGHMHEVLAGDTYHAQTESVPEQTWSSASFLRVAVGGLFGLDLDAEDTRLELSPHLPANWEHASLRNVRFGGSTLSFDLDQQINTLALHVDNKGRAQHIVFHPEIPLGSQNLSAVINGRRATIHEKVNPADEHAVLDLTAPTGKTDITLHFSSGIAVVLPHAHPSLGDTSAGMKMTAMTLQGNDLHLSLDVTASQRNTLKILTRRGIRAAVHATVRRVYPTEYELTIDPPEVPAGSYGHQEVTVTVSR